MSDEVKEVKPKYYSLNSILRKKANYNMIIGERSNGKTYAVLKYALQNYFKSGCKEQFAYIRRWATDIKGKRATDLFSSINLNGEVTKMSDGKYDGVTYWNGKFYFCTYDDNGKPIYSDGDIVGHIFALNETEHNKSISYPLITTVIFDEFLTRNQYLVDEFVVFMNTLSTIIRQRNNVIIFMLGNTVNKYSPYFEEMGLTHIQEQKQGSIETYSYGNSDLTVAVEYCGAMKEGKQSDKYFAFDNPKLNMITSGVWELALYNHLPCKYYPENIAYTYFIEFNGNTYQAEIIRVDKQYFTYIHDKTTPIKDEEHDLIYSLEYHATLNYCRNILKPITQFQKKITWFFLTDNVCYQNNTIGDAIHNYLMICRQKSL